MRIPDVVAGVSPAEGPMGETRSSFVSYSTAMLPKGQLVRWNIQVEAGLPFVYHHLPRTTRGFIYPQKAFNDQS